MQIHSKIIKVENTISCSRYVRIKYHEFARNLSALIKICTNILFLILYHNYFSKCIMFMYVFNSILLLKIFQLKKMYLCTLVIKIIIAFLKYTNFLIRYLALCHSSALVTPSLYCISQFWATLNTICEFKNKFSLKINHTNVNKTFFR